MAREPKTKDVRVLNHQDTRLNIPTAEVEPVMREEDRSPVRVAYDRRNRDLDPQLVWRGKDEQDWSDLVVHAPPIYIQEKVHPKALIDDLVRQTARRKEEDAPDTPDLFADFNGLPDREAAAEFYQHQGHWTNRFILGDSLQVMASLAEKEGLRGKVQCVFIDPPYGIKFNSNFQWSTQTRNVDDKPDQVTREPEMVKAFRDTWKDGIHSYLTYLRDRLTVIRDLLHESGSAFVQIGDENVHRVRTMMDEVFGPDCFMSEILIKKKGSQKSSFIDPVNDYVLWYSKSPRKLGKTKYRSLYEPRELDGETVDEFSRAELPDGTVVNLKDYRDAEGKKVDFRAVPRRIEMEFPGARLFRPWPITNGGERANQMNPIILNGVPIRPPRGRCWSHTSAPVEEGLNGMGRNRAADRLVGSSTSLDFKRYLDDFPYKSISNWWDGFGGASSPIYVVQTNERIMERIILMCTDPGDLVLDPTCGSGTTAYVSEQWGRRWITIDTSRVALALARARLMAARYPFYLLRDTEEGLLKESELRKVPPPDHVLSTVRKENHRPDIRQGFVYRRCAYVTSGLIANNDLIDEIWERFEATLEPLRARLNALLGTGWDEWQVPRNAVEEWAPEARQAHADWWTARNARQREIDESIIARADPTYLFDKPYKDNSKIRVAGPFTVESLSPHRTLAVDHDDELIDSIDASEGNRDAPDEETDFVEMVMENLKTSGVQQVAREDRITFSTLQPWPGEHIAAEARYQEGEDGPERRAGIFIGPEFGTIHRADLVAAARECGEAVFDILIAVGFSFSAQCTDFAGIGRIKALRARMNPDLHMADDLKNTGTGNLFVVFGEPDIDLIEEGDRLKVRIKGVDVFKPQSGEIISTGPEGIACWFIDTDYDEQSFFVRHAYFLGANDPYKALKATLKAEVDEEAWSSLNSDVSRAFNRPSTGRIAVKVINHLGDEVMKVFSA